jgi:aconitate hydratase
VIAESYERIHRSNLLGMGVLPLEFLNGENVERLELTGTETFSIPGVGGDLAPGQVLEVHARTGAGVEKRFRVRSRLDTPIEIDYFRNGGILQTVLRGLLKRS